MLYDYVAQMTLELQVVTAERFKKSIYGKKGENLKSELSGLSIPESILNAKESKNASFEIFDLSYLHLEGLGHDKILCI